VTEPSADSTPVRSIDDLELVFHRAHKPRSAWLIGAEAEKFALDADTLSPLPYTGERSVLALFALLEQRHGWLPSLEYGNGPLVALTRGRSSVTLEPGAQVELSASPLPDVYAVCREIKDHLLELRSLSDELNLRWLSLGFQPLASGAEIPWVPKERYPIMRRYLPTKGSRAHDMMQRTCTVQANFDYDSEEDALRKLRVMLKLAPLIQAVSANAPFKEGRVSRLLSERADVWLHMDPERSGLVERVWRADSSSSKRAGYRDYVEWALDAGMFLFRHDGKSFHNTGQTFRSFLQDGFEGQRATLGDWTNHLGTLFPEVRLKSTLEVRTSDAQSEPLSLAMIALFTGLLYDEQALAQAEELTRDFDYAAVVRARNDVPARGLAAQIGALAIRPLAERMIEAAAGGLSRRARLGPTGKDEALLLEPLAKLVAAGLTPAEVLRKGLAPGDPVSAEVALRAEIDSTRRSS
jgi:glutamate--cysteine ligase